MLIVRGSRRQRFTLIPTGSHRRTKRSRRIPKILTAPAITGTAQVGQVLTVSTGTWSGSPISYAYQWARNGADIAGATAGAYVLTVADAGAITCRVSATNASGTASALSGAITVLAEFSLALLPIASRVFDLDANTGVIASGSLVSQWAASSGTLTVGTTTPAEQPTLVANGWSPGKNVVRFNGLSSGNILRSSSGSFVQRRWTLLAAARPFADQNAVSSFKPIYETARLADGLGAQLVMQRVTTDAAQDKVYATVYGGGGPAAASGFAKGTKAILVDRAAGRPAANSRFAGVNGTYSSSASTTAGTTTRTQRKIGGSDDAVSARAAIDLARIVEIDTDQLPGKAEQIATLYLIEGYLAWAYGTQGSLRADHPFAARAPVAADYTGNNRLWQQWGTSIGNGTAQQLAVVLNAAAVGITVSNGCVGGTNSAQHVARFNALQDSTNGTASGLSADDIRKKLSVFGDFFANDVSGGISWANGKANLAGLVAAVETAQGVAPGQGHIIVWGYWRGSGNGSDAGLADADSKSAELQALYPNYFLDMGKALAADAAPTGPMPDASAYTRGVIPLGYRADGTDLLHLNTAGYVRAAQIQKAFAEAKGWAQ